MLQAEIDGNTVKRAYSIASTNKEAQEQQLRQELVLDGLQQMPHLL